MPADALEAGAEEPVADAPDEAGGAALAVVVEPEAAEPDEAPPLEALPALPLEDALEEEPPLGGSTATPPLEALEPPLPAFDALLVDAVPFDAVPLEALPPEALAPPLEAWLEPDAALPDVALPEDGVDVVDDVEGDEVAGCAELWVVELCAGGVLVWVLCPTGKNEPPVIKVAMIPAITATRAIPISRSGQLRLSQSMVPF